ncbi:MAG: arylsulfatase [Porticoccaceae bacterium]
MLVKRNFQGCFMINSGVQEKMACLRDRFSKAFFYFTIMCILSVCATSSAAAESGDAVIGKTYAESKEAIPPALPDAKGAPNIVWILLDDVGFGASSAFGGLIQTPTLEDLADNGLRYTNFHTAGICSPTRAALLTGRNHHKVGMGMFPDKFLAFEFPGYTGRLEPKDGTIAEYLRTVGYSTYALGKWHLTPDDEMTDLGPFERWPTGKGFDHFFGFLWGAADQYKPDLVEDLRHVEADGRHLNAQLFDKAISYIDRQQALDSGKPFFMYIATGAGHSPHQSDQEWLDKYKGRFDAGWDIFRQEVFERQKRLGVIPDDAILPERDPRVEEWDSLSSDQKAVYARFMEGYAAFLDYTDYEIGRLVKYLESKELLDNTAIFVIVGDNGGSKEGGVNGSIAIEGVPPDRDEEAQIVQLKGLLDDIGTAATYSNYPIGWGQATNTPFQYWKGDANSEGGTRNPMIVHWPKKIKESGVRNQYSHVIDLLPTTLEIAGAEVSDSLRGISQTEVQGVSLAYSFNDANAETRRNQQHFFIGGSGAIVKDGWKAGFGYRPDLVDIMRTYPAPTKHENNAGKEVWSLYNLNEDFNERIDLAAKYPEKLEELKALFDQEAKANQVYPLINWSDINNRTRRDVLEMPNFQKAYGSD